MQVVDPGTPTAARRLPTAGLTRLLPNAPRLIEAGFVLLLGMVCLFGFRTTFDSWYYLVVSAISLGLGILVAHLVLAARWHWTLALAGAVVAYFAFGGAIAVRRGLIAGFIPSGSTLASLWSLAINGWKELLTWLPPLDGTSILLALPCLLGLVVGAAAYALARTFRPAPIPLIPLVLLFGLVIALGTDTPAALIPQSLALVVGATIWVAYRATQQSRLTTTSTPRAAVGRVLGGAAVLVVAGLVAALASPYLPGLGPTRQILRDHVESPIDLNQYPSPMPSFRKYSSVALKDSYFYESSLMTVTGASPGSLIRFAVLDSYDGLVWGAGGGGFRKVGSRLPTVIDGQPISGDPVKLTITIDDVYASQAPLNIWVPSLGYATAISFSGATATGHRDALAYDLSKGQGLVLDQVRSGDVITVESIPTPVLAGQSLTATGMTLVPSSRTAFIGEDLAKMTGGNVAQWDRLVNLAEGFRKGGWSDGTTGADFAQYTPGDGENRLKAFLATLPSYVGSDEQYAAMFALVANRIGFPARVVFGAIMPTDSDTIQGRDVTIWVELRTTDGWVAIPPEFFIPPRDQLPQPPPPEETTPPQDIQDIADPNPKLPPDKLSNMDTQAQVTPPTPPDTPSFPWWGWAGVYTGSVILALAALVGLLLGIKAVRTWWRHRRGTAVTQIAGGWSDVIDRLRDLGIKVPKRMTRQEQVAALVRAAGVPSVADGQTVLRSSLPTVPTKTRSLPPESLTALTTLARSTDRAMFSAQPPTPETVEAYWAEVSDTKQVLLSSRQGPARLWTRLTPRSLPPLRRVC